MSNTLMNYVHIEPVTVPIKGEGTFMEVRSNGFPLNPSGVSWYYAIRKAQVVEQDGVSVSVPGEVVLEGNLYMDRPTYDLWSDDDNYVFEWAAGVLNLTIIPD